MANIKVSEMTQADSVNDNDLIMIVQNSTNKKITKQTLMSDLSSRIGNIETEQTTQNENIQSNSDNISALQGRVTTNEDDIDTLQSKVATTESDIETLQTEVTELQEDVQNLRNASYKVSGSGTNFSLNNTTKNKFIEFLPGGNTEQTQLSGKNLLDTYGYFKNTPTITSNGITLTVNNDGSLLLNGTATALTTFSAFGSFSSTDIVINLDANKTYNLAMNSNQIISENFIVYVRSMENGNLVSKVARTSSNTNTFTSSTGITNYSIQIPNGTTLNNVLIKPQLEEGTTATDYEPYCGGIPSPNLEYPQLIYNVTGNVNNKIENKNLLPFKNQDFTIKGINFKITNGKFIINGTATGEISSASTEFKENFSFMLSPGTYYFKKTSGINGYVRRYDNNVVIQQSQSSFTVTEKVKAYYGIYMANATSKSNEVNTDQVEVGSAFTVYEEHQEQNLPFTLEEGQKLMLGDTLQDDGIHNKMAHSTINITSIIPLSNGNIGGIISLPNKTHKSDNYLLCNKAIFNNSGETGTIYENPVNCVIVGTPTDTLETMQEKYNGSIVEYELENEEIEPYNETQASQYNAIKKAMSNNDQTNISSESDEVGMIIDATAVGDINKAISNIDSRVSLLE